MLEKKSSGNRKAETLHARRRRSRRRALSAFCVVLALALGAGVYGLWQKPVRVAHVQVSGTDAPLAALALDAMRGSYLGIIPRNSIFFVPQSAIRRAALSAHPEIAALSIRGSGFTSLTLSVNERIPVARWCGEAFVASSTPNCYVFDAGGYVYALAGSPEGQRYPPLQPFDVYDALSSGSTSDPVRTTLKDANALPAVFDFAREIGKLASTAASPAPVAYISIHDGQVDDVLQTNTRVCYVLGDEQNAFAALASAAPNIDFSKGAIDYIDLRFPGKVYVKKTNEK